MAEDSAPKGRPRWGRVALAAVLLLLVVAGAVAWLKLPAYARQQVVERARQHGVAIELGEVELGWSEVAVVDFRFSLIGVPAVRGKIDRMVVSLDGMEPTGFGVDHLELDVSGSAGNIALALGEWTKNYPQLYRYPVTVGRVGLLWRSAPKAEPWLRITDAKVEPAETGGRFTAAAASVLGVGVGRVGASWRGDDSEVAVGFGVADLDDAPVSMTARHALQQPEVDFVLRPTPLERLAGPLGVALPLDGVTVDMTARLRFAEEATHGAVDGRIEMKLAGYKPPVPPQLQGFAFGDETTVSTVVEVSADRRNVVLRETKVKHGSLELDGEGTLVVAEDHASINLSLEGQLSCKQLAAAATRAQVPGQLGGLLSQFAAQVVRGSVAIELGIDGDSRDLAAAKLTKKVGVGCGLEKFDRKIPTELPEELRDAIPEELRGKIPTKLPDLPPLPPLPKREPDKKSPAPRR